MNVRFDIQEITDLAARWQRAPEIVREELERAMTQATLYLERETKERTPVGVGGGGGLRGSIHSRVSLGVFAVEGVVGSPLTYAPAVELGSKPHFPPIEPLQDWVKAKLGITDEKESRSVAYAIATVKSRSSTLGQRMFGRALDEGRTTVMRMFQGARERIVARMGG